MAFARLTADVDVKLSNFETKMTAVENRLKGVSSKTYWALVMVDTAVLKRQVKTVNDILGTIGKVTAQVDLAVNGEKVVVESLRNLRTNLEQTSKAKKKALDQDAQVEKAYFAERERANRAHIASMQALTRKQEADAIRSRGKVAGVLGPVQVSGPASVLGTTGVKRQANVGLDQWKAEQKLMADAEKATARNADAMKRLGNEAKETNSWLQKTTRTITAFGTGYLVISAIGQAFRFLKEATLDFSNTLAQTEVGFTTLFTNAGDSIEEARKKAAGMLDTLKEIAVPTPFALVDLAPLTQQAMAFGLISAKSKTLKEDLKDLFTTVGDAAYGLGRGQDGVNRIILAFGQMKSATRVMGQDMLQLQQLGVNAWKYLAEATGKTTGEVRDLVSKGLIPADQAIKSIEAGMKRDFGGAMARAALTLGGAMAQIKDTAQIKLSGLFKPAYNSLTEFAVKLAKVMGTREFDRWAIQFQGKISVAFAFVSGLIEGFVDQMGGWKVVLGATIAFIGARFTWLAYTAVAKAAYHMGQVIMQLYVQWMTASLGITAQIALVVAAVAAFAIAYNKNLLGVRWMTDQIVFTITHGMAEVSIAIAKTIEFLSQQLNKVPNELLMLSPGALGLKKLMGDQSGLGAEVEKYWAGVEKQTSKGAGTLAGNMASPVANAFKNALKGFLPDIDAALKDAEDRAKKAAGKGGIPGITIGSGKDKAAEKAEKERLKRLKDALGDSAQAWDAYASAAERAAQRQIDAIKKVADSLSNLFDPLKKELLDLGIINDPLNAIVGRLEKMLNLGGRARAVARAGDTAAGNARLTAAGLRAQQEAASGLDANVPVTKGGGAMAGGGILDIARSYLGMKGGDKRAPALLGSAYGQEWCAGFVRGVVKQGGISNWSDTNSVAGLRAWAKKAGLAYTGTPRPGDVFTLKGGGSSHTGFVSSVNGGRFSAIGGNEGNKNNLSSRVKGNNTYSINDARIVYIKAGGSALRSTSGHTAAGGSGNPPVITAHSLMDGLRDFTGELSSYTKVPTAWGDAVGKSGDATIRFATQTLLASKDVQKALKDELGAGFNHFLVTLRVAVNKAEVLFNHARAVFDKNAAIKGLRRDRQTEMADGDPMRLLEMEFGKGEKFGALNKNERAELRVETYATALQSAMRATNEFQKSQLLLVRGAEDSDRWLEKNAYNATEYSRAMQIAAFEQSLLTDKTLLSLSADDRKAESLKRVQEFTRGLDATLKSDAIKQNAADIDALTKEFDALNETTIQQIAYRKVYLADNAKLLSGEQKRANYLAQVRLGMAQLAQQYRDTLTAMRQSQEASEFENRLLQDKALSLQQVTEATEVQAVAVSEATKIIRATGNPFMAFLGGAFAGKTKQNEQAAGKITVQLRNYKKLVEDTTSAVQLAAQQENIYRSTLSGTPEQDRALAKAAEMSRLQSAALKGDISVGDINESLRLYLQRYDAEAKTAVAQKEGANAMQAQMSLLRAQSDLATQRLDTAHQLSDVERQRLGFDLQAQESALQHVAVTKEEKDAQDAILAIMQKMAKLRFDSLKEGITDQIDALGYKAGKAREQFEQWRDLLRDPNLTNAQRADIFGTQQVLRDMQEAEERTKQFADAMASAWNNGWDAMASGSGSAMDRIKAGVGSMVQGVAGYFRDLAKQIATNYIITKLLGMGGLGDYVSKIQQKAGAGVSFGGQNPGFTPSIASSLASAAIGSLNRTPQAALAGSGGGLMASRSIAGQTVSIGTLNVNGVRDAHNVVPAMEQQLGINLSRRSQQQGAQRAIGMK